MTMRPAPSRMTQPACVADAGGPQASTPYSAAMSGEPAHRL